MIFRDFLELSILPVATQNSMQKINSMIPHSQYSGYSRHDKYLSSRVIKIRYTSDLLRTLIALHIIGDEVAVAGNNIFAEYPRTCLAH